MRSRFRACLLLPLVAAAAHAAIVGPEQPVAVPTEAVPEAYSRTAAMVTDGENFLAVWNQLSEGSLQAAIVTKDGVVSLPRTIDSSRDPGIISACWTGSVYLLTWYGVTPEPGAYVATIGRDGTLLRGPTLVVRGAFPGSVASNGRRALMTYAVQFSSTMNAALFDDIGNLIAADLPLFTRGTIPYVASDGNEFAVVWQSFDTPVHTVRLVRVSESGEAIGTPLDLGPLETSGNWSIAFGGGVYAIVAVEQHVVSPTVTQPRLVRILVDPRSGAVTRQPAIDTVLSFHAGVLWSGSRFMAYWITDNTEPTSLFTLPFSTSPETSPPKPVVTTRSHAADWPAMAWNGRSIFGGWSEALGQPGYENPVRGAFFDPTGEMLSVPFLVSRGWSRQFSPAIATSGAESLIVWVDSVAHDRGRVVAIRIGPDGTPLDPEPFEIADTYSPSPAVAYTGSAYLVVWEQSVASSNFRFLAARRVGRNGALGDPVSLGQGSGAVAASTATTTLVVFQGSRISGCRFNADAERIDSVPIAIGDGYAPRVATNGTDFFVAWNAGYDNGNENAPNPPGLIDVFGARVTAAGAVDARPLPIATGPSDQSLEAVGSDGRDYILFYSLIDKDHPDAVMAVKRIVREGQLDGVTALDPGAIIGPFLQTGSIIRNGGGFRLAGSRHDGTIVVLHTDLAGNAIASETLTPPSPFAPVPLPPLKFVSYGPAGVSLAAANDESFQIAYPRRITEGVYEGTSLVFYRFGGSNGPSRSRAARH